VNADERMRAAAPAVAVLTDDTALTQRVKDLEAALIGRSASAAVAPIDDALIGAATLVGALELKAVAGQIDTLVHVCGVATALAWVLEPDETIVDVSLGAGTGDRLYDLETDRRIAEFKFTKWQAAGHNSAREQVLLADIASLAEADTTKDRYMYVLDVDQQRKFLESGRSLASMMARRQPPLAKVREVNTVGEYWAAVQDRVRLVDLVDVVPEFGRQASIEPAATSTMTVAAARGRWPDAALSWHAGWVTAWDVDEDGRPALVVAGNDVTDAAVLVFDHPAHRRFYAAAPGWMPS
jgi:hypothetical protein